MLNRFKRSDEWLRAPAFRDVYDAYGRDSEIVQAVTNARRYSGLTQKQLSAKTGITQADISKLENGVANPSLSTLRRIATAMGMTLKVEFCPAISA